LTDIEKIRGKDQPPIDVPKLRILGEGDSTFSAMGDVRIDRT
jgi:hypothetical protein